MRGRAGFFRAGRDDRGTWWLLDPADQPIFLRCAHGVRALPPERRGPSAGDSAAQLREWGFNAVGVPDDAAATVDLPTMGLVDFARGARVLRAPGLQLPDVFDPDWPALVEARALEVCSRQVENRALVGWVTDAALAWAQVTPRGRPTLLQLCLSLEPGFAAYHAAWEFVLALHGGRLAALARAWGVAVTNKEVVRELTRSETGLGTRGYLRDHARWTREFARRYFTTTAAAIRAVDANHLLCGCRFGGVAGADVLAECVYPAVDVAMPDWRELPPAGTVAALQPILAGDVSWVGEDFWRAPEAGSGARLTAVERMLRRARGALERVARHPAVVGYAWAQWQDEPGEQPPFARGLVHGDGTGAREHTELLAQFNGRADRLHASLPHPKPA